MMRHLFMGLAPIALLAACVPGTSEFSCKGYPDGVQCLSARKVYDLTQSRSRLTADQISDAGYDPETGRKLAIEGDAVAETAATPPAVVDQRTVSLQPPAGVMRIWLAPRRDRRGDLIVPGYIFSEIEPTDWTVDPPAETQPRLLEPLRVAVASLFGSEPGPVRAVAHQAVADAPDNNLLVADILFELGSAEVTPGGRERLRAAADQIAELEPRAVRVSGFTDRVGSDQVNLRLSERRANNVARVLQELGVSAPLEVMPKGETMLPHPTADGVPEPYNRKVGVLAVDVTTEDPDA